MKTKASREWDWQVISPRILRLHVASVGNTVTWPWNADCAYEKKHKVPMDKDFDQYFNLIGWGQHAMIAVAQLGIRNTSIAAKKQANLTKYYMTKNHIMAYHATRGTWIYTKWIRYAVSCWKDYPCQGFI